jgi:Membrane iron-sulfur containing protein FtrD-like
VNPRRSNARSARSRRFAPAFGAAAAGLAALAALAWWSSPDYRCIAVGGGNSAAVLLNVSNLGRSTAQKYCWRTPDGAHTVRFIVARRSDNAIAVVLDACRICYLNKLGYRISRGAIMCRFCGNRYSIDGLSAGTMSCMPFTLPFKLERGWLRIGTSDLKASVAFFPPEPPAAFAWLANLGRKTHAMPAAAPQSSERLFGANVLH